MSKDMFTESISPVVTKGLDSLSWLKQKGMTFKQKAQNDRDLGIIFGEYLTELQRSSEIMHTILDKSQTIMLKSSYVKPYIKLLQSYKSDQFSIKDETAKQVEKVDSILNNSIKSAIVYGKGGAGKTTFFKALVLNEIDNMSVYKRIPIYIKLRELNNYKNDIINNKIKNTIRYQFLQQLNVNHIDLTEEALLDAMKKGYFSVFLDGFDELDSEIAARVASDISNFILGTNIWVLVSSRPETYVKFDLMKSYVICDLSQDQAETLINTLNMYPQEIRNSFIKKLKDEYSYQFDYFAKNPLLLICMFLVYQQKLEIPHSMPVFLEEVFDVLYSNHSRAQGFKREHVSGLDEYTFKQLFACFSFKSYIDNHQIFRHHSIIEHIQTSAIESSIKVDSNLFLEDITKNVCLLYEDGSTYEYTHRLFQEYFAAMYLFRYAEFKKDYSKIKNILEKYILEDNRYRTDFIFTLIAQSDYNKKLEREIYMKWFDEVFDSSLDHYNRLSHFLKDC